MRLNSESLYRSVKNEGIVQTEQNIIQGLESGDIKPDNCSIRALYENLVVDKEGNPVGAEIVRTWERNQRVSESLADAVSMSTFSNVIGQLFYSATLPQYLTADMNVSPLFGVIQSNVISGPEKVGGVGNLGDIAKVLGEIEEIPMVSPNEDWIYTPQQLKRGARVPVSREAVISDRLGLVLERARTVADALALSREIEACDTVINANGATERTTYNWRKEGPVANWQTSAAANPYFVNVKGSNGLVDWQSINNAYIVMSQILDPQTGQPLVDYQNWTLLCTPENAGTAMRIKHALQYRTSGGSAANPTMISDGTPVVDFNICVSKFLYSRLVAAGQPTTNWYFGDFSRAYKFMRAFDYETQEAMANSGLMFSHDIAYQWRCLKMETASTFDPRRVCKNTVA